jgi:molecular chaperone GrpE (heat shock protein)
MPKSEITLTDEFASTMQQLVAEAEKTIPPAKISHEASDSDSSDEIREDVAKLGERIGAMEKAMAAGFEQITAAMAPKTDPLAAQLQRMDEHMVAMRNTDSVNQRLFNSLHQELKEYRDNFLRDSLQKPFIRDLVVLFDDLSTLSSQMQSASASAERQGAVGRWCDNLDNAIHSLMEIMHRMEVTEIEPKEFVDRACHKVVTYEPADFAEDDGRIVMRVKRGFVWRDQVLRPEEVVAKRFA